MSESERSHRRSVMESLAKAKHFVFMTIENDDDPGNIVLYGDEQRLGFMMWMALSENPSLWRSMRAQDDGRRLSGVSAWTAGDEMNFLVEAHVKGVVKDSDMPDDRKERIAEFVAAWKNIVDMDRDE